MVITRARLKAALAASLLLVGLGSHVPPVRAAAPPLPATRLEFGLANGPADLSWMTSSGGAYPSVPGQPEAWKESGGFAGSTWQDLDARVLEPTAPPAGAGTRMLVPLTARAACTRAALSSW